MGDEEMALKVLRRKEFPTIPTMVPDLSGLPSHPVCSTSTLTLSPLHSRLMPKVVMLKYSDVKIQPYCIDLCDVRVHMCACACVSVCV